MHRGESAELEVRLIGALSHFVEARSKEGGLVRERTDEAALITLAEEAHRKALPRGVRHVVGVQDQHPGNLQHTRSC